jgi:hypothetical protein
LLYSLAIDTSNLAKNSKDKRGSLMRKSVEGATVISGLRPSSRGKLSSLTKK